jgi:hypothetical protein
MWGALMLAWLTAGPTTVALEKRSPCAPREVLERELRQSPLRLVEGEAELRVTLTPTSAGHLLSVRTADGVVVLERALPTASCSEAGVAAALILDRSARDIIVRLPDAGVARKSPTAELVPATQDTTKQEEAARPKAAREKAERDSVPRNTTVRDAAPRDTAAPDTSARDSGARDSSPRDPAAADLTPPIQPRNTTRLAPPPFPPGAEPTPPLPTTAPLPTPAPSRQQLSTSERPAPSLSITNAPRELEAAQSFTPRQLRFELTFGGGVAFPTPATISALFSADAALQFGPWRAGVLGAFSLGGSNRVLDETGRDRGTLSAQTLYLLSHAMACSDTTVQFCGGLRVGVRLDIGRAAGPLLFQTRIGLATAPSTGLAGRVAITFGPVLIALDATFLVNLLTPSLELQGLSARIDTPRVELLVNLSGGIRVPTPTPPAPSR